MDDKDYQGLLKDPEFLEMDRMFNVAMHLGNQFIDKITQKCIIKFSGDTIDLYFYGHCPSCPLPGIEYYPTKADRDAYHVICPIGDVFYSAYTKLFEEAKILGSFTLDPNRLDDVYQIVSDLHLLEAAVASLDNAMTLSEDFITRLSYFCMSDVKPFYGKKELSSNVLKPLNQYLNCKVPDYPAFFSHARSEMKFSYTCDNLYQMCGAILDYLCQHTFYDQYNSKPHKYSLRRCPRCGHFFTTVDRKVIYCHHIDENGKTCAEWQEADRKKKFAQIPKNDAEELAEKIRRRLYSYRMAIKISRNDYTNDPRYSERDELYRLYTKCCKEHSQKSDFAGWIKECTAQLPKSRNESYDKFKKWLLERS